MGELRSIEKRLPLIQIIVLAVVLLLQVLDRVLAFPRWLEITCSVLILVFLIFSISVEIVGYIRKKKNTA